MLALKSSTKFWSLSRVSSFIVSWIRTFSFPQRSTNLHSDFVVNRPSGKIKNKFFPNWRISYLFHLFFRFCKFDIPFVFWQVGRYLSILCFGYFCPNCKREKVLRTVKFLPLFLLTFCDHFLFSRDNSSVSFFKKISF